MGETFAQALADAGNDLHVPNMRDQIAHVIGKAISTGFKTTDPRASYISGRVSAFQVVAADLLSLNFGVERDAAWERIKLLVRDVRNGWPREDLLDPAKVGHEAHVIMEQALRL